MSAATNHLLPEQLSRYVDRALTPDDAATCARHLATCDTCHRACEELRHAGRLMLRTAPRPELDSPCPPASTWDNFVGDGSQPDVEQHLVACPNCRAVLAERRVVVDPPDAAAPPAPRRGLVCFRCRAGLEEADQFCPQCGAQITERTGTGAVVTQGPGAWFTHLWLVVSVVALVVSFWWGRRFYQCLTVSLGSFLFWLHLRNPVRQYLDVLTALQRGDTTRADAVLENLKRRLGVGRR